MTIIKTIQADIAVAGGGVAGVAAAVEAARSGKKVVLIEKTTQLGGLATPRTPAERQGDLVITAEGRDVTGEYTAGAEAVLLLAKTLGCTKALLKERSPSCGSKEIYDGSFSRRLIRGMGITAQMLTENGVAVYGESQWEELL